jgi:UDP-N-acetylmuramyl pentapeptide synthase
MLEQAYFEIGGHKKVGRRVVDTASYLVTVGKLGRIIAQEAMDCGMPEASVYMASSNEDAAQRLEEILEPGDIVLVSGAWQLGLKEIVDELIDTHASLCEV